MGQQRGSGKPGFRFSEGPQSGLCPLDGALERGFRRISRRGVVKRREECGRSRDKPFIKIQHAQEFHQLPDRGREGEFPDGFDSVLAGAMPSADTVWPRNFSCGWSKTHLAGFKTSPKSLSRAKSFARWTRCSSAVLLATKISFR